MNIKRIFLLVLVLIMLYFLAPFLNIIFSSLLIVLLIAPVYSKFNKSFKNDIFLFLLTFFSIIFFLILSFLLFRMLTVSINGIQSVFNSNILSSLKQTDYYINELGSMFDFFILFIFSDLKFIFDFVLMNFLVFYMLRDSKNFKKKFLSNFNKNDKLIIISFIDRLKYLFNNILFNYFLISLLLGTLSLIVFSFLKFNYYIEISTLVMLLNFIPNLGSWMLLFFIGIFELFKSNFLTGSILIIVSFLFFRINSIFLKRFNVKKGIDRVVLLFGIISGVLYQGVYGFITGPIIVAIIQVLYEFLNKKKF